MNWRSLILGLALRRPAAPMPAAPATVRPGAGQRSQGLGSAKKHTPTRKVPAAPMPVHTA